MSGSRFSRFLQVLFSREVVVYLIVGVLTTIVNFVAQTLLNQVFGVTNWWFSTAPAILIAILFAYVTNRIFVFRSKGPVLQELWKFISSRILVSLVFEYGGMFLLFNVIGWTSVFHFFPGDEGLQVAKLPTQVLVMAGNYVISKFLIFRTTHSAKETELDGL